MRGRCVNNTKKDLDTRKIPHYTLAMSDTIQLKASNGKLELPCGGMLLYVYEMGDCDQITVKKPNLEHLKSALYGAREMGDFASSVTTAILPNGETLDF
jgi:hypothetical protein